MKLFHRSTCRQTLAALGLGLLTLLGPVCVFAADEEDSTDVTLGLRVWYPEWKAGDVNLDSGLLNSLYVGAAVSQNTYLTLMAGLGEGWEIPNEGEGPNFAVDQRYDIYGSLDYDLWGAMNPESEISLRAGVAGHWFGFEAEGSSGEFVGYAVVASVAAPVAHWGSESAEHTLSLGVFGGYYPQIWLSLDNDDYFVDYDETDGYLYELKLTWAMPNGVQLQAGWRQVVINNGLDRKNKDLIESFNPDSKADAKDEFGGPFVQVNMAL